MSTPEMTGTSRMFVLRWRTRILPRWRREHRDLVYAAVAKASGRPAWHGPGTLVAHYAIGLFHPTSLCLKHLAESTNEPPRTLIGLTCRRCVRLHRRARDQWLAASDTRHSVVEARVPGPDGDSTLGLVCRTCVTAREGDVVAWPCQHAKSAEIAEAGQFVAARADHAKQQAIYDEAYGTSYAPAPDSEWDFEAHLAASKAAEASVPKTAAYLSAYNRHRTSTKSDAFDYAAHLLAIADIQEETP